MDTFLVREWGILLRGPTLTADEHWTLNLQLLLFVVIVGHCVR